MNRNLIATIVVVIIIALAAGGYYFMNQQKTVETPLQTAPEDSISQPSPVVEKASLKSFMAMGGIQKCDFTDTDTENSGTVFISSGKMRGDFSSNIDGKVTPSHMISDSKDIYIWMDNQVTGFKTSLEAIEQVSGTTGTTQTIDVNKQVDYSCGPWVVDPVKFLVPDKIKFQDMGKMMKDAAKLVPSASVAVSAIPLNSACAACDNLEGDSQTQCKKALKCN